jgi:tryptophan synthase beta chain
VLNHVLMHQTVIGEEALAQFEMADDYPDVIIAPTGGGLQLCRHHLPLHSGVNLRGRAGYPRAGR